jgi:type II secretory pathway component GspD/PulD (secretin)
MWSDGTAPVAGLDRSAPVWTAIRCTLRSAVSVSAVVAACAPFHSVMAQGVDAAPADTVIITASDQMELQGLVDYVGRTLDVRFLYGEELKNQRVELRPSPVEIPRNRLMHLLASLLRVRDLAMVEESAGFFRIVRTELAGRTVDAVIQSGAIPDRESLRMVTHVLTVPSGNVEGLADKLERYVSSAKGSLLPVPEKGLLIVTDYESRVAMLKELVEIVDGGAAEVEMATIPVTGGDCETVASRINSILTEKQRITQSTRAAPSVRGNMIPGALVVLGTADQIEAARAIADQIAPPARDLSTRSYALKFLSTERAETLVKKVALAPGSGVPSPVDIYGDSELPRLIVTAEPETHAAIAALLEREDQPLPQAQRPLRVYRPRNRKAAELMGTLTQLLGEGAELARMSVEKSAPAQSDRSAAQSTKDDPQERQVPPEPPERFRGPQGVGASGASARIQGPDYVLTEDEATNAIIAIGSRTFHDQLSSIIESLDHRRPQVLIEMKLVAVTTSDSEDLGVEIATQDLGGAWDYLAFSSFGLSTIDLSTGERTPLPGVGANGIVFSPGEVSVVLHALATKGAARVLSTPKLLVSDNARGTLRNVDEAPFTSVNASDTVATTSFAGFESAGTTLSVTPHIAEGDHLTLDFELSFSNFTGGASGTGVPPPRTTNSFASTVEIPDGYTVITGGLEVDNKSDTVSEVPLLGRIPLIGAAFQNSARANTTTRIYAFIRPSILRDDEFEDLKYISLEAIERARLDGDNPPPPMEPKWMR